MPATYEAIATTTLSSDTSSYTFSSIPSTFTDLVLQANVRVTTGAAHIDLHMRFNGDTNNNYSGIGLWGSGSSAGASIDSTANYFKGGYWISNSGEASDNYTPLKLTIKNYSSTSVYKHCISECGSITLTNQGIKSWTSTSAINSLTIFSQYGDLVSGSSFTLYGIKAA